MYPWMSFKNGWFSWMAGILFLTCVAYGAALNNLFIPFDDNTLIYMNSAVAHLSPATLFHVFTSYDPELYIPLTFVLYQWIHLCAGFNPMAYHAMSLLLHLLNCGLVAWIIWQLTQRKSLALIVSALFALHPLQSEAVLWAAAMKDILSATFGLLSIALYLQWRSKEKRTLFFWCIACFLLGLLAKVSIAPLPILFLLIDWMQGRRFVRAVFVEKWPLYLIAFIFVLVAVLGKTAVIGSAGWTVTALLPFKATAFYLLKILWPVHLSLLYPQPLAPTLTDPAILFSIAVVAVLLLISFVLRHRARLISGGILWYLLLLIPSFSTFYKNEYLYFASNRYAYLPSIGLFLIIAILAMLLWDRWKMSRIPLIVLGSVASLGCVIVVHAQAVIWHDSKSLFANVIQLYPISPVAYNNEATEFHNTPEALVLLQKAIAIDPFFILAYRNIANYYQQAGEVDLMALTYQQAEAQLFRKPHPTTDDLSLLYDDAEYKDENGDHAGALALLQKAVDLHPDFSESYYNLGIKYEKYGDLPQAQTALQKAVDLNGADSDSLYHLAGVFAETGALQHAVDLLQRLIAINPSYPNAQSHLADIKHMLGQ
jgi:tetratricopeptide (TPR) repeat protein